MADLSLESPRWVSHPPSLICESCVCNIVNIVHESLDNMCIAVRPLFFLSPAWVTARVLKEVPLLCCKSLATKKLYKNHKTKRITMSRASYLYKHLVVKGKHKNWKLSKFSGIVPLRAAPNTFKRNRPSDNTWPCKWNKSKELDILYVLYLSSRHH